MKSTTLKFSLGFALALLVMAPFVRADVNLAPGTSQSPVQNDAPFQAFTAGGFCGAGCNILAEILDAPYTIKDALGNVTQTGIYSTVVLVDSNTGNLDFAYEFEVETGTDPYISEATASSFGGFTTEVGYDSSGIVIDGGYTGASGLIAPTSVNRSAGPGVTINFEFTPGDVGPSGYASYDLLVETNASFYTAGTFGLQDNANSGPLAAFAPATVPEPTSVLLLTGVVLAAFGAIRRKTRMV
jgi:hypothetical protein